MCFPRDKRLPCFSSPANVVPSLDAPESRLRRGEERREDPRLADDVLTPLFQAAAESTEEAIVTSLVRAVSVEGHRGTARAFPWEAALEILREAGAVESPRNP